MEKVLEKRVFKKSLLVFFLIVLGVFTGCDKIEESNSSISRSNNISKPPIVEPIDYLSLEPGTVLNYEIEIGEVEPLFYREVIWPQTKGSIVMATRGRYASAIGKENSGEKFILKVVIKGLAAEQGPLEYPIGVELTVEKDDLGIYKGAKKVFWAATTHGRFICHEVITHSPDSIGAPRGGMWGTWGAEDGYSLGILFFGDKPGIGISTGGGKDKIFFIGFSPIPESKKSGLYFVRKVEPNVKERNSEASFLNKGFEEHLYFSQGEGLVYLKQVIEGKTSMTWRRK